jgi:hypothetical protein
VAAGFDLEPLSFVIQCRNSSNDNARLCVAFRLLAVAAEA